MKRLRNHSPADYRRSFLACSLLFATAFTLLFLRLAYLQVWKGDFFRNLSENNRIRLTEVHAPRGRILDANHVILADNRPCFDVTVIPEEVRDFRSLQQMLSGFSPMDPSSLRNKLAGIKKATPFRSYVIWKDASWSTVAYIEANRLRMPGVMIQVGQARDYCKGELFAHALGYMGEISAEELRNGRRHDYRVGDSIGKVGIEKSWENALRGKKGGLQIETDAMGRQIAILNRKEPVPGKNLLLSLDTKLQEEARRALGQHTGAIVAADPRDGRILCYLSRPSFDPNRFVTGLSQKEWNHLRADPLHPLTDRVIRGLYPPASIFKIVVAIAALEEGIIKPAEKLSCSGSYLLGTRRFRCWRRGGHGAVDLHRALVESCDVYFYQVGQRLGIERIQAYARRLGFGQKTGILLEGENAGLVPSPEWKRRRYHEPWYQGETLGVSIGQGALLVTPIQVLGLISAVANGGSVWRPRLVAGVAYPDGRIFMKTAPDLVRSARLSERTVRLIQEALRDVVADERGTGARARLEGVDVAGKTGTAQISPLEDHQASETGAVPWEKRDHAWFACYAPAETPEIAVVVLVEHGGHGGETAAPIARKILEAYFRLHTKGPALVVSSRTGRDAPGPAAQ